MFSLLHFLVFSVSFVHGNTLKILNIQYNILSHICQEGLAEYVSWDSVKPTDRFFISRKHTVSFSINLHIVYSWKKKQLGRQILV